MDIARRIAALEAKLPRPPQAHVEFLDAQRRLAEADAAVEDAANKKWICEVFRLRQAGQSMIEALRLAELPASPDYPGRAEDEAIVQRYRDDTGWTPPFTDSTEETDAEIAEDIYMKVISTNSITGTATLRD